MALLRASAIGKKKNMFMGFGGSSGDEDSSSSKIGGGKIGF